MKNITISPNSLEDFIWMSYRYCIGRHTIAAASHAGSIANLIFKNLDKFEKEKLEFMASDIRQCILDNVRFNSYIKVVNQHNNPDWDFYSELLLTSMRCPTSREVVYTIDFDKREVTWKKIEDIANFRHNWEEFDSMYTNLIPWVKLANALDSKCHKKVTARINNRFETEECFPYVAEYHGVYMKVWASVEHDANSSIHMQQYMNPDMIIKIE